MYTLCALPNTRLVTDLFDVERAARKMLRAFATPFHAETNCSYIAQSASQFLSGVGAVMGHLRALLSRLCLRRKRAPWICTELFLDYDSRNGKSRRNRPRSNVCNNCFSPEWPWFARELWIICAPTVENTIFTSGTRSGKLV